MTKRPLLLGCLGLLAITLLAYLPVFDAGFVWDDDAHLTAPALRSLGGLWRIWTEIGATQQYYPLLHSLFWIEQRAWGDAPLGYHLTNIALHATAAVLLFLVLRRLAIPGAWFAAALFAVHPIQVETAAWISEQKNTLSTVLYLSATLVWLRFDDTRARSAYGVATLLFALALLSKSVTATLPAALLVVTWWKRGRLDLARDVVPLVPWLLLGAIAGVVTVWVEREFVGADGANYDLSGLVRCLLAGRIFWFYPGKLVWPSDLTFFYPRWTIDPRDPWQWLPAAAALVLVIALWSLRRRTRAPLAAVLIYAGSLVPVSGWFDVYPFRYSFVADHFQYLPGLALFALAGGVIGAIARRYGIARPLAVAGLVLVAGLAVLTWRQATDFRDAEALYRATLARNPAAWIAHNNLGRLLMSDARRQNEAIACFETALQLRPDYYEARNNLGLVLTQAGRHVDAIPHLEEAARLRPDSYQVFNNLGIALAGGGRIEEAIAAFDRAVALHPRLANLHENFAKALGLAGREREARDHLAEAARLRGQTEPETRH